MPIESETAAQAEARRERQRKANGGKPWHPGGPGRPPKDRSAVATPRPKAKKRAAVRPAPVLSLLGPKLTAVLPQAIADLEAQRAKIDATIAALKALQA